MVDCNQLNSQIISNANSVLLPLYFTDCYLSERYRILFKQSIEARGECVTITIMKAHGIVFQRGPCWGKMQLCLQKITTIFGLILGCILCANEKWRLLEPTWHVPKLLIWLILTTFNVNKFRKGTFE